MVCNRRNLLADEKIQRLRLKDPYVFILERNYMASQDSRRMTVELKETDNKRNKAIGLSNSRRHKSKACDHNVSAHQPTLRPSEQVQVEQRLIIIVQFLFFMHLVRLLKIYITIYYYDFMAIYQNLKLSIWF